MKTEELKITFIEMRAKGLSFDTIASELKVARATLFRWNSKMKTAIDEKTLVEREKIVEKHNLSENERLRHCCTIYNQTVDHVQKLPLGSASADRLLRLLLTLDARISRSLAAPVRHAEGEPAELEAGGELTAGRS